MKVCTVPQIIFEALRYSYSIMSENIIKDRVYYKWFVVMEIYLDKLQGEYY